MANQGMVTAPYNFVSFPTKVIERYPDMDSLPRHDGIDPALKTGEIHISMVAKSNLFISDGNKTNPNFFRGPNGKFQIPGSTLRGAIRSNMQILGCGLVRKDEDFEDFQVYFRKVATDKKNVEKKMETYYKTVLGVKDPENGSKQAYATPDKVEAGYLRCDGKRYVILPTLRRYATQKSFFRVSRTLLKQAGFGEEVATTEPVAYREVDGMVKEICPLRTKKKGMQEGTLLWTGRPVKGKGGKLNHLYVFPKPNLDIVLPVPEKDVLSYRIDWETRQNVLGSKRGFWKLPGNRNMKPVFYVQHEGHLYFGMSRFLRIGHKFAFSQGLPDEHRRTNNMTEVVLDYPHAVFGFATADGASYRSRVSFGECAIVGDTEPLAEQKRMLMGPKPSYYPGYVVEGKHYSEGQFLLRGYKQYWMKDAINVAREVKGSSLRPLPKGTQFHGVVRFKNLHEDELGLLLWALQLDEGCYQSLGMGKPYGYGRVKLTVDKLLEESPNRYTLQGLCQSRVDTTKQVASYIDAYDTYATTLMESKYSQQENCHLRRQEHICDFLFLRRTLRKGEEVEYMDLKGYTNIRTPLPTIADVRKSMEVVPPEPPVEEERDWRDMAATWKNQTNTRH